MTIETRDKAGLAENDSKNNLGASIVGQSQPSDPLQLLDNNPVWDYFQRNYPYYIPGSSSHQQPSQTLHRVHHQIYDLCKQTLPHSSDPLFIAPLPPRIDGSSQGSKVYLTILKDGCAVNRASRIQFARRAEWIKRQRGEKELVQLVSKVYKTLAHLVRHHS